MCQGGNSCGFSYDPDMELSHVTLQGPPVDDQELLEHLPQSLVSVLTSLNGFVQFGGGLHVRGACLEPDWHSLRRAWFGPGSIRDLFPAVRQEWVPFAEDCVGDQFLLKSTDVIRLSAETGELEDMGLSLGEFLRRANADPIEFLAMEPLLQFHQDHGELPDGHLVHAYPPFCTKEAANGVSLGALPAWELHQLHSELAKSLPDDGGKIRIEISN